jgi:hypothetical protein
MHHTMYDWLRSLISTSSLAKKWSCGALCIAGLSSQVSTLDLQTASFEVQAQQNHFVIIKK